MFGKVVFNLMIIKRTEKKTKLKNDTNRQNNINLKKVEIKR